MTVSKVFRSATRKNTSSTQANFELFWRNWPSVPQHYNFSTWRGGSKLHWITGCFFALSYAPSRYSSSFMISASPSLTSTSLKIGYPKNLVSIEPPCISSMAFVWYFQDLWAHFQMIHIVGPLKSPVNLPIAPLMVDCSHTSCTDCCTLVTSASTAKTSPCPEMFWGHNKLGLTSLLKEENNDFDPVNPLLGQYHIQTIFNFRWGCPDKISGKKHPFFGCYISG